MENNSSKIDTKDGAKVLADFFDEQINLLIKLEPILRTNSNDKVSNIHPLFSSLIEDSISIRILGDNARLNQCYIISRALLERLINYCYLQISEQNEFDAFIAYSKNKAARGLSKTIEAGGEVKATIEYGKGECSLPNDIEEAVQQFTSSRGREITRWTKISLPDRADLIDKKAKKSSLFMHLLAIYSDASEAIHGTLYGSLFHLGVYNPGNVPSDQETLDKHRYSTLSTLYLLGASAINTMISFMYQTGIVELEEARDLSDKQYRIAAVATGLLKK